MNQFTSKPPKHSPKIEIQIIGSLIFNEETRKSIGKLKAEYFYSEKHRIIFSTIKEMMEAGEDIDYTLLVAKLTNTGKLKDSGGADYISEINNTIISHRILPDHYKVLLDCYKERNIRRTGMELETTNSEEIGKWCNKMAQQIEDFRKKNNAHAVDMETLARDTIGQIEFFHLNKGKHMGLQAGFPFLSKRCPLMPKDMIALGGAPSTGKTAFAMTLLWNISKIEDKHVLFFSCEMSKESIMMRFFSMLTRINLMNGLMSGNIRDSDWDKLTTAEQELSQSKIIIDEDSGIDIEDMVQKAKEYKLSHPDICFIVIDQIKFVESKKGDSREERTANVSGKLKRLAKELNLTILVLTQLLKEAIGRRPTESDIKNSGALLEDSDVTWLLYRDKKRNPEKAELIISKQRNGPAGIFVELGFVPECTFFYEPNYHGKQEEIFSEEG